MTDIFDATILCKNCNTQMEKGFVSKKGTNLRAVKCNSCNDTIVHPADLSCLEQFKNLKDKQYNVKLRMVGNSHAISIPKEIINFIKDQERMMDNIVHLHLEDMHRLTLDFGER